MAHGNQIGARQAFTGQQARQDPVDDIGLRRFDTAGRAHHRHLFQVAHHQQRAWVHRHTVQSDAAARTQQWPKVRCPRGPIIAEIPATRIKVGIAMRADGGSDGILVMRHEGRLVRADCPSLLCADAPAHESSAAGALASRPVPRTISATRFACRGCTRRIAAPACAMLLNIDHARLWHAKRAPP